MPALVPDIAKSEAAIVELANIERSHRHLTALRVDPKLAAVARDYAARLARTGAFAHDAGSAPIERVRKSGYAPCTVAENLAMRRDASGFESRALARSIIEGWRASPVHNANLMNPALRDTGVGIAKADDPVPKYVAVQVFASPQFGALTFEIANLSQTPLSISFAAHVRGIAPGQVTTLTACSAGPITISAAGGSSRKVAVADAVNGRRYSVSLEAADATPRIAIGDRTPVSNVSAGVKVAPPPSKGSPREK